MGASKKSSASNQHGIAGLTPLAQGHLAELAELSDIAMQMARGLGDLAEGKSSDQEERLFVSKRGIVDDFARIARVVRQIITLEQEIAGLRPLPKRRGADDNSGWRATFDWANVDPFKGYRWPAERNDEHDADDLHHYDPVTFNALTAEMRKDLGVGMKGANDAPPSPSPPSSSSVMPAPPESHPTVITGPPPKAAHQFDTALRAGPVIHANSGQKPHDVDARIKSGHDEKRNDDNGVSENPNGPYAIAKAILARSKARQGHDPP